MKPTEGPSETRDVYDPFEGKTVHVYDGLADRLRGRYAIGPMLPNGEPEFGWSTHEVPPIQKEAAAEIEQLRAENASLRSPARPRLTQGALDMAAELARLRKENADMLGALRALVRTLTAVENSPSFQGIWGFLHAHGYIYSGPDWKDALVDARGAIAQAEAPSILSRERRT